MSLRFHVGELARFVGGKNTAAEFYWLIGATVTITQIMPIPQPPLGEYIYEYEAAFPDGLYLVKDACLAKLEPPAEPVSLARTTSEPVWVAT